MSEERLKDEGEEKEPLIFESSKSQAALLHAKKYLGRDCYLDAELLLAHVLQCGRIDILTKDFILDATSLNRYKNCIEERKKGKPLQYILNKCEFMGLDFYVDENVLIPRCDTEVLVEKALEIIKACWAGGSESIEILELCTGSGCIAVSLAYYLEQDKRAYQITAVDIDEKALAVARRNAESQGLRGIEGIYSFGSIRFLQGDLFVPVIEEAGGSATGVQYDLLLANPPYIPSKDVLTLDNNVRDYEPHLALDGGESGLDFYCTIAKEAGRFLKKDGMILLEIGYNQAQDLRSVFDQYFKRNFEMEIIQDLSGLDRVAKIKVIN